MEFSVNKVITDDGQEALEISASKGCCGFLMGCIILGSLFLLGLKGNSDKSPTKVDAQKTTQQPVSQSHENQRH